VIKRRAFIAHDTTRAMRRHSNTYTVGMAVTLVSEKTKVRGLSAREVYTVKQNQTQPAPKKKDFVTLVDAHGKEHTINVRANGEKLELGAIGEIELQAGDRLWFRANSSGVTNGTLATLAGTDEQGRLVTTDGFVVPEDYLKIAHGYATTSHSSQGLTANFAVVFGASFDQKRFLSLTVGRGSASILMSRARKPSYHALSELKGRGWECSKRLLTPKRKMTVPMVSKLAIASPGTTRLEVGTDMPCLYPAW